MELNSKDKNRLEGMLLKTNKNGRITKPELGPCWEISGPGNNGYIKYSNKLAHRESYRLHKGNIPTDLLVRHKCNNRCCINPEHLETGTKQDNRDDMTRDGTVVSITKKGFNNGNAKLTDIQVSEIRELPKIDQRSIAAKYGVSQAHIHRIQSSEARNVTHEISNDKEDFFNRAVHEIIQRRDNLTKCWETNHSREVRSYKNKKMKAYVIAYLYENKDGIPNGYQVLHHCDNEKCINPDHLYAGTPEENKNDMKVRNRFVSGEKHGMAKLTSENVIQIYTNKENLSTTEWAKKYSVSSATILGIKNRKNWKTITSILIPNDNPDTAEER